MRRWLAIALTLSLSGCSAAPVLPSAVPNPRVHYMDLSATPAPALPAADSFALATVPPLAGESRAINAAPEPFEAATPVASDPIRATQAEPMTWAEASTSSAATQTYEVFQGEWLDDALSRWLAREGRVLRYQAPFRVPVLADAVLPATTLPDAVRLLLTPLWGTPAALVASEKSGSVLEVTSP